MSYTVRIQSLDSASQSFGAEFNVTPANGSVQTKGKVTVNDSEVTVSKSDVMSEYKTLFLKNEGNSGTIQVSSAPIAGATKDIFELDPGAAICIAVPAGVAPVFYAIASTAGNTANLGFEFRGR